MPNIPGWTGHPQLEQVVSAKLDARPVTQAFTPRSNLRFRVTRWSHGARDVEIWADTGHDWWDYTLVRGALSA